MLGDRTNVVELQTARRQGGGAYALRARRGTRREAATGGERFKRVRPGADTSSSSTTLTATRRAIGCLRRTTDELQAACRTADAAFRIGGDEFALVIAATSASSAAVAAERAAEAIAAIDPRIVASYGVATYPEDAGTQEGLLAVADRRLYAMKHARRGLAGSRG